MITLTPEQQELFTGNLNFFIEHGCCKLTEPETVKTAFRNFASGKVLPEEEKFLFLFFDMLYKLFSVPFGDVNFSNSASCHRTLYLLYPILEWVIKKHVQ